MGELGNDYNLLMKIRNLMGVLMLNKRDFIPAIAEFKLLRDIAEEAENDKMRMHAYSMLGNCY